MRYGLLARRSFAAPSSRPIVGGVRDTWETEGWRVDARSWPLLLLELRDGLRDDVAGYGEALYSATRRPGPFASVTTLSFDPRSATPRARQQFAEAVDRAFESRAIAEAVVSPR